MILIAPLSANTMAKIVNGICDNLLTSIIRAWNFNVREETTRILDILSPVKLLCQPIVVAPAMNTFMFNVFVLAL